MDVLNFSKINFYAGILLNNAGSGSIRTQKMFLGLLVIKKKNSALGALCWPARKKKINVAIMEKMAEM